MADRPRDDAWWIASDGKWYPPNLQPDFSAAPVVDAQSSPAPVGSIVVPRLLTRIATGALIATSITFVVAAFFGLQYGTALRSNSVSDLSRASAEAVFLGWSSLAVFAMVVTGALILVWTFRTSKAFDARGAANRRWNRGWTIGAWFIPLASFVLPKLVFNELEKISQVPFVRDEIGNEWKEESHSAVGDLWWLLWVVGLFLFQATQVFLTDPTVDAGTVDIATSLSGLAHAILAAAGVALVVVMWRIEATSRV
jgi:hypothetical protein